MELGLGVEWGEDGNIAYRFVASSPSTPLALPWSPSPDHALTQAPFLLAASGHTDSLHLLIDSGERADITDVMDAYGQ